MAEEPKKSRRARYVAAACVVLVLAIVVLGFLVSVPTTSAVTVPYRWTSTSEVAVASTSTEPYLVGVSTTVGYTATNASVIEYVHQVMTTAHVLTISRTTLYCNQSVYAANPLVAGADVQVTWNATGKVDVYVFNSTQFDSYLGSEQITSSTVNQTGEASGVLRFRASSTGSYFFFILDPPVGRSCLGAGTIWVSAPGGPAIYSLPVTSYTTEYTTYTAASQQEITQTYTSTFALTSTSTELIPVTLTSTSTTSCAPSFWAWIFGPKSC
ncbi:MAG TPA: hypothetical protein VKF15_02675 [Nitrososphaerales archaeon]|nr:hypothetical protein [Nitrososphaerales archaeon]